MAGGNRAVDPALLTRLARGTLFGVVELHESARRVAPTSAAAHQESQPTARPPTTGRLPEQAHSDG